MERDSSHIVILSVFIFQSYNEKQPGVQSVTSA